MLQILGTILVYYAVFVGALALTIYIVRVSIQFLRETRKQNRQE